ncbi:MAG: glycosyltransferase [Candidatus Omnitrophota bacterium]
MDSAVKGNGSPLVSVIIPTRNRSSFLERAIESVLAQTYKKIELIVVDDASDDDTAGSVMALREKVPGLVYIRNEKPGGGAASRNTGIRKASGEYIAFLDDDDEWMPGKLNAQVDFFRAHPDIAAVSCYFIIKKDGRTVKVRKQEAISFDDMLWDNFMGSFSFAMVRSSIFGKVGYLSEDLSSCHDWDFWIRVARIYRIGVVPEFLCVYRWHTANISDWTERTLDNYAMVYEKNKDLMSRECRKYHLKKQMIFRSKLKDGRGRRMRDFIMSFKRSGIPFTEEFTFVVKGLLALFFRDLISGHAMRRANGLFQEAEREELADLYAEIHKDRR